MTGQERIDKIISKVRGEWDSDGSAWPTTCAEMSKEIKIMQSEIDKETARAERWKNKFLSHVEQLELDNCIEWYGDVSIVRLDDGEDI